jgi:hypothetical protein
VRWLLPLLLAACAATPEGNRQVKIDAPALPFDPRTYACARAPVPIGIDGAIEETWDAAPWSEDFVDIEGDRKPKPRFRTRMKMLWDDEYLYIAVEMEEPHLQASFTKRDSFIFHEDNDIEVFLDPNADTHSYMELEVNALGTEWDLFLTRPYRDGGMALHGWDIKGLKSAVKLDGTLNDGSDVDRGWTIEFAFPWKGIHEAAGRRCPPEPGDRWRVNFSRVQWKFRFEDGRYVKGKKAKEDNWVWSPQGLVSMHYPERWGIVQFTEKPGPVELTDEDLAREELRQRYYAGVRSVSVTLTDGRRMVLEPDGRVRIHAP